MPVGVAQLWIVRLLAMQIAATSRHCVATAIGALSRGATAFLNLIIENRSEDRRHSREHEMKAALGKGFSCRKLLQNAAVEGSHLVIVVHVLQI